MTGNFYKVILRYGHIGIRKEVSVARYLNCESSMRIIDVLNLASQMPGVKSKGILEIDQISYETYLRGKEEEKNNFYLQKLMTFNSKTIAA